MNETTHQRDPLGLLTDAEYQAWLDASERRPVTDEERAEIQSIESISTHAADPERG